MQVFLGTLTQFPDLVTSETHCQEVLPWVSRAYMTYAKSEWLMPLLHMTQQLGSLEASTASKTLQTLLLHCPWQQDSLPFS